MNTNKEILKICMQKGFLLDRELLGALSLLEEHLAKKLIMAFLSLSSIDRVIKKESFLKNCNLLLRLMRSEEDLNLARNFFASLGATECDFNSKKDLKKFFN